MKGSVNWTAGFVVLGSLILAGAQDGRGPLVTTAWLAGQLDQPRLVLLHVGGKKDYEARHIPGARLVELGDLSVTGPEGLRVELPPAEQLEAAFSRLGISGASRVVLYAGTESPTGVTRVYFTLDNAGFGARTAILDGGLAAWTREGRPVSTEQVEAAAVPVQATRRTRGTTVDAAWVHQRLGDTSVVILDARLPEFHTGVNSGEMPRAGRIPGARNLPYSSLLDAQGRFLPTNELLQRFESAGARRGKRLAVYCHIGMQATVVYFAARLLGYDVRLYDGSFQDWSRRPELPVEAGAVP